MAILFKQAFKFKSKPGVWKVYKSFEVAFYSMKFLSRIQMVIVYGPPPSTKNGFTTDLRRVCVLKNSVAS